MITKKELELEFKRLEGLDHMVQAFEEIAASRMMRSRQSVLSNRIFIDELGEAFTEVITAYKKSLNKIGKSKNKDLKNLTFLNKNGKKADT